MYHDVSRVKAVSSRPMTTDLYYAAWAVVMTWLMVFSASFWKAGAWTPEGMKIAFGNRADTPEASPAVARAGRAASNMLENLPLYLGLVLAAHAGNKVTSTLILGAHLWFWS